MSGHLLKGVDEGLEWEKLVHEGRYYEVCGTLRILVFLVGTWKNDALFLGSENTASFSLFGRLSLRVRVEPA